MPREFTLATIPRPWNGSMVLLVVYVHDNMPEPVIELVERHRYRERPPVDDQGVAVPLAALSVVVPYFEGRLDVPPDQRAGSLQDRLVGCLTILTARGVPRELNDITGLYICDHVTQVAAWYAEAGVSHELTERRLPDRPPVRTRRHILLRVRPKRAGYASTLWLELSAEYGRAGVVRFQESYKSFSGEPYQHAVEVDYAALGPLVVAVESRLGVAADTTDEDLEARLVAALKALIVRGELGDNLPYRRNRDLVRAWCEEAGLPYRLDGRYHQHDVFKAQNLPDGDTLFLNVNGRTFDSQATVEFSQLYFPPGPPWAGGDREPIRTRVITPLASLDTLVEFFEQRLQLPTEPATEQRLVQCFTALVERRELGAPLADGLSPQANADRVAAWFAAAGVPYEIYGERKYLLLKAYRPNTGCIFTLSVSLKTRVTPASNVSAPVRRTAVTFSEYYDYMARTGDPGREYGYSAGIPETPADRLVEFFEQRLGLRATSDDLDARLVACFGELVHRGELADGLPLEANRDRVAEVLAATGVPVKTDASHWFNSD